MHIELRAAEIRSGTLESAQESIRTNIARALGLTSLMPEALIHLENVSKVLRRRVYPSFCMSRTGCEPLRVIIMVCSSYLSLLCLGTR